MKQANPHMPSSAKLLKIFPQSKNLTCSLGEMHLASDLKLQHMKGLSTMLWREKEAGFSYCVLPISNAFMTEH